MKSIHVVGYKNSGKTTLITKWVQLLKSKGKSVAVLKHHGHKEPLEMPDVSTDSMQYLQSGADLSVVAGGGAVQLQMNCEPAFHRMKEMAASNQPDVLLIEGYKQERGDKVVLVRSEEDWAELQKLQGIQLVIGSNDERIQTDNLLFQANSEEIDRWLLNWLEEGCF